MKVALILVIISLSLFISNTGAMRVTVTLLSYHNIYLNISDAKGFGYKRMKSPGRSMKVPKSRKGLGMGMGMGMGAGMGMGLGMGMGAALLIPVVIPMRHGYGRHRNSYRYGNILN